MGGMNLISRDKVPEGECKLSHQTPGRIPGHVRQFKHFLLSVSYTVSALFVSVFEFYCSAEHIFKILVVKIDIWIINKLNPVYLQYSLWLGESGNIWYS